jgi:CSLREA domain-containing protein
MSVSSRRTSRSSVIRILLLVALLGTAVVAMPSPVARAGTTIIVNELTDEENQDGDCSLREAITASAIDAPFDACPSGNGVDLILLPAGTFEFTIPPFETSGGALFLGHSVTIRGAGMYETIIDANQLSQVFRVGDYASSPVVSIERMTLRGGYIDNLDDHGGGILNNSGNLTLRSVWVTDNETTGRGGAIYNDDSSEGLTVLYSRIDHNRGNGGAIDNQVDDGRSRLTISDSIIRDNTSDGIFSYGEAMIRRTSIADNAGSGIAAFGSVLRVVDSTITGNTAATNGGGMRIGSAAIAVVVNSTISGNMAPGNGGGISYTGVNTAESWGRCNCAIRSWRGTQTSPVIRPTAQARLSPRAST